MDESRYITIEKDFKTQTQQTDQRSNVVGTGEKKYHELILIFSIYLPTRSFKVFLMFELTDLSPTGSNHDAIGDKTL